MTRNGSSRQRDHGFTLVELLVSMVIASLLATVVLMAMWGAQETARASRTQSQISRINALVLEHWHGYSSRNLEILPRNPPPNIPGRARMYVRLALLRDAMRMELPDRISDLQEGRTQITYASTTWQLASEPRAWRAYRRRLEGLIGRDPSAPNNLEPHPDFSKWSLTYQSAECLYLIVASLRNSQSSGLDFFKPSEIGDLDGDGVPEILDGWGRPISFLRWAPGFASELQPDIHFLIAQGPTQTPDYDPDHLDPLKVDPRWADTSAPFKPFLLVPLIYSAGPDGEYGIVSDNDWTGSNGPLRYISRLSDPYQPLDDDPNIYIGELDPAAYWGFPTPQHHYAEDNITNHLIEVR